METGRLIQEHGLTPDTARGPAPGARGVRRRRESQGAAAGDRGLAWLGGMSLEL